jgi:hypothetical protein
MRFTGHQPGVVHGRRRIYTESFAAASRSLC